MSGYIKSNSLRQSVLVFTGMPLLIWSESKLPEHSLLKESLSIMMIHMFSQMVDLFFWSRSIAVAVKDSKLRRAIKIHKAIGYTCAAIMLLHLVFLVALRLFEAGAPNVAFLKIIATYNRMVLLGISLDEPRN